MSEGGFSLRAAGLGKQYREGSGEALSVLSAIDFSLGAGETIAIIGASGSGKSTLLNLLGGLDTPTTGQVMLNGRDLFTMSEKKRSLARNRHLGFIYQFHHLLPEFTAMENVVLPQLANGAGRAEAELRAADLLARVGVGNRADHRPAAMSGGEQQRVAFCRALANGPRLLLADEPTGNLDPATSEKVFETLIELARGTGLSALIATHNMALAARMDRVLRLGNGVLAAD